MTRSHVRPLGEGSPPSSLRQKALAKLMSYLTSVRRQEQNRFLFFFSLAALLSMGQTLGLVGSESLLLATLGANVLPQVYILASLITVLSSLAYATGVDSSRNDNYFVRILLTLSSCIGIVGLLAWLFPAFQSQAWVTLICLYYANLAICTNHFWTFTGDFFDTISSKRLFPLFAVGSSCGGLFGGLVASVLTQLPAGPLALIFAWVFCGLAAALWLRTHRAQLRRWGPLEIEEADETSIDGLKSSLRYLRFSRLGRLLVLASLFMVSALFISQYLYSAIFVAAYPNPHDLAVFLGVFLALANAIELAIELKITPWLLRRTGVANSNLVHPLLTLLAFLFLGLAPTLASGILARLNRETIDNAIGAPVRNLIFNALPARLRGRIRAFLEGIVIYSAMALAGITLIAWERQRPTTLEIDPLLCLCGFVLSGGFLLTTYGVKKDYVEALLQELQHGRIDLEGSVSPLESLPALRLIELWENLIDHHSVSPKALHQVGKALAHRCLLVPLKNALSHPDDQVRLAAIEILCRTRVQERTSYLQLAVGDPSPRLKLFALSQPSDLRHTFALTLIHDPHPAVQAEASLHTHPLNEANLVSMLRSPDDASRQAALIRLPQSLAQEAFQATKSPHTQDVVAALSAIKRLQVSITSLASASLFASPHLEIREALVSTLATAPEPLENQNADLILQGLADPSRRVRLAAIDAVYHQNIAASILEKAAQSPLNLLAASAIQALGKRSTESTRAFLSEEVFRRAQQAWLYHLEARNLERDLEIRPSKRFLRIALLDASGRDVKACFQILSVLEESKIVRSVEKVLRFARARIRADALEVLSNLGPREAASLLVHLLEEGDILEREQALRGHVPPCRPWHAMLAQLEVSPDRFLNIAATQCLIEELDETPGGTPSQSEQNSLMEHLLMLKSVPLFEGMTLQQLEAIHQCLSEQHYLAGELIFAEGDIGDELFIVLEGEVEILIRLDSEQPFVLGKIQAGTYFGEMSILDNEPRSAAARVTVDTRALTLKGDDLKELIYTMPEIAFTIFRVLSARQRQSDKRLNELMNGNAVPLTTS